MLSRSQSPSVVVTHWTRRVIVNQPSTQPEGNPTSTRDGIRVTPITDQLGFVGRYSLVRWCVDLISTK